MNGNKVFQTNLIKKHFLNFEKSLISMNSRKNFFSFIKNIRNANTLKRRIYTNFHFRFFEGFGGFGGGPKSITLFIYVVILKYRPSIARK